MVNVFFSKVSDDGLVANLNKLKENLQKEEANHIFIVPDRMTVIVEKRIFEELNIESTTNVEVLTISRLAGRLIKDKRVINEDVSCMLLQKILKAEKNNLKCFNKNLDSDLSSEIFGTISQFKSCKVNFNEVEVKSENKILQDKLKDISLLYKKYQEELKKKKFV